MPIDAASLAPKLDAALRDFSTGLKDTRKGDWDSGYLWDPGVMAVRGKAGTVQKLLQRLKQADPTIFESMPKDLADAWEGQFTRLQQLLDTIHLDGSGSYRGGLADFDGFSHRVNEHVQAQLAARAKAAPAADAARGSDLVTNGLQTTKLETTSVQTSAPSAAAKTASGATTDAGRAMTAGGDDVDAI